ncbi:MAG: hypothetical protein QOI87_2824 [Bradyrhizobium sp.]|jgi:hypothetical protein|nr:hypothetical protein [Bradyrhizobium sp.]
MAVTLGMCPLPSVSSNLKAARLDLWRSILQHLIRPVVVGMEETSTALLVGQLRVDSEAGADGIFAAHFLG